MPRRALRFEGGTQERVKESQSERENQAEPVAPSQYAILNPVGGLKAASSVD